MTPATPSYLTLQYQAFLRNQDTRRDDDKSRRHRTTTTFYPFNAVYETGEELFLGTCDSKGVGGVGVLVNTSMAKNVDSFEQRTT
ncbi:hypothetical protein RB195_007526 [Necator americanus]|uniref:Uncharacterized protein n=1 Tax=Necator americanus TaxID=51031 RepID=A0ABR1BXN9_NECAM